jgi:hypothetical protein
MVREQESVLQARPAACRAEPLHPAEIDPKSRRCRCRCVSIEAVQQPLQVLVKESDAAARLGRRSDKSLIVCLRQTGFKRAVAGGADIETITEHPILWSSIALEDADLYAGSAQSVCKAKSACSRTDDQYFQSGNSKDKPESSWLHMAVPTLREA